MDQSKEINATIDAYVGTIFRHKLLLAYFNLAIILLMVLVVLFWPRKYGSESKIWLRIGRENSKLDPTASTGKTIAIQETGREDEIKSVLDVIASRGIMGATVDKLTPEVVLGDAPLPNTTAKKSSPITDMAKRAIGAVAGLVKMIDPVSVREEAIREIEDGITVEAERKSNVVSVVYEADSPELAQAVVTELVNAYKQRHSEIHHTIGSRQFFTEQTQDLRGRVARASESLREAKSAIGIASIEGQRQILEAGLLELERVKMQAVQRSAEATALVDEYTKLIDEQPQMILAEERVVPNTGRDLLRARFFDLQMNRMQLESQFPDDNPLVVAAKAKEDQARNTLADETTEERGEMSQALNQVHQSLALELAKSKAMQVSQLATLEAVREQHGALREQISRLNASDIKIKELERELMLAERNYISYANNSEDARVDEALNQNAFSNISIAMPATLQEKPVSPSKTIVAVLGLAAMAFGTGLLIVLSRYKDAGRILDEASLQRSLDIPVAITIPNQRRYTRILK